MKKLFFTLILSCLLLSCNSKEPMEQVVERGMKTATSQAMSMARVLESQEGKQAYGVDQGKLKTCGYQSWCSGFFPGVLWYTYEYSQDPELKRYAELFTARLEKVQYLTNHHDVGFMLGCSYGNGYRLTGNKAYKDVLIQGARSLSTRYRPSVKAIRSWDWNKERWQYPVIIDNMMNLELMTRATELSGEPSFKEIAVNHANTTLKNHFRPDYSSYHVVSYDTLTGKPHAKHTHQGYSDDSDWSRGQSWGLYGFTMMYRETGKPEYLEQARHIAAFLMHHPAMPEDKIPYWDYKSPDIPNTPRDASAGALMASALLELAHLDAVPEQEAAAYRAYAEDQLRSLSSPEYLSAPGENCNFVLKHSTGYFKGKSDVDSPLCYADYYYIEALLRWQKWFGGK